MEKEIFLIEASRASLVGNASVYKVLSYGDRLYFCRVGREQEGDFLMQMTVFEIDEDLADERNIARTDLLSDPKSFYILLTDIKKVKIRAKPYSAGTISNNGTVKISLYGKILPKSFWIHEATDYTSIEQLLKRMLSVPVRVTRVPRHTA